MYFPKCRRMPLYHRSLYLTKLYFKVARDLVVAYSFNVCVLYFQPDRTYKIEIHQPPVSYFLLHAAGIKKGAMETGRSLLSLEYDQYTCSMESKYNGYRDDEALNT